MKLTPLEKENLHLVLKESQILRLQNLLEQELKASENKASKNKI